MNNSENMISRIREQKILPLFYHQDTQTCLGVIRALYDAGIRVIEFTNRGECALDSFKNLVAARNREMPDLVLAAGTIRTATQAKSFIDAGADFLVSPVFDAEVSDIAYLNKILWIPGCMTPTEIHLAESNGCKLVKIFPGNLLGPSFISSIKELFPNLDFIPTGGVENEYENISAWFSAGVCAVGMGSKLISKKMLDEGDYSKITQSAKEALANVRSIK
jgi:2-dehydro-3-deoxyphosphogluconate aldolase / (4S)-4-hydroxy-2-oxoglutarate aldolase